MGDTKITIGYFSIHDLNQNDRYDDSDFIYWGQENITGKTCSYRDENSIECPRANWEDIIAAGDYFEKAQGYAKAFRVVTPSYQDAKQKIILTAVEKAHGAARAGDEVKAGGEGHLQPRTGPPETKRQMQGPGLNERIYKSSGNNLFP